MDTATFADHNVTVCFDRMEDAKNAVERLEQAGVSGSSISLLGPAAEEAATDPDTRQQDARLAEEGARATLGGAAAGAGIGGTAGLLAGAAAFGIPGVGPVMAAGIWATTLGGAAAGGGVGFAAGAMGRMKQSKAWELTLAHVAQGKVVVGAHTDDADEFARAVEVLEATDHGDMQRFDAEGDPLDA